MRAKDKSFNASLQTDFDNTIGQLNVVRQDIGRVLINLFNNAFYSVTEKQRLLSATGEAFEPTVSVATRRSNTGGIELHIRDNGGGIPQNIVDKIYHPFFT